MPTEKKAAMVADLEDRLARSRIAITTNYRGLTVTDMANLRRRLGEVGAEVKVAKLTLARLAAERVSKQRLAEVLAGPTAIVFGYTDEVEPARVLTEFIRMSRLPLSITGGLVENRPLTVEDVTTLATLPPRQVLLGLVVGGIQSPIAGLVGALNGIVGSLAWALQARIRQLEEQSGGAAAASA
ncbi:MAG: 50S ribosomal protein L10 [Chloroflexi bacterium]|nr:50S ribosomal protein L10 [Chloroflexota bacterium]